MILRRPRSDADWDEFYGCRDFPECRGTRDIIDGEPAPDVDELDDLSWI